MISISLASRSFHVKPLGNFFADKILSLFMEPLKNEKNVIAVAKTMETEFKKVLVGQNSCLKKTHTFIQNFPDGKENGYFLGIHFEEGIIEMAGIRVKGLKTLGSLQESVVVPEEERLLRGTERVLFVAKALKQFSRRLRLVEQPDLGFVWNLGINYGYLEIDGRFGLTSFHTKSWPDEYNFTGKPVRMKVLRQSITSAGESIGMNMEIKGFLHTPEAVFLDGIWKYPSTIGALALHSEHRCSTCVKAETLKVKRVSHKDEEKPYILLKVFWDEFGHTGELDLILNDFDREVDKFSPVPGKRLFYQCVSEEYILKLIRLVLIALADNGVIFESNKYNKEKLLSFLLEEAHGLSTMSRSYSRGMGDQIMRTFGFDELTVKDTIIISRVIEAVSWRAAFLLGILISVYVRNIPAPDNKPVFLINGSYSEKEISSISTSVRQVLSISGADKISANIHFSTQSHVLGAAVLAAIYTKNPFDYDSDFENDS